MKIINIGNAVCILFFLCIGHKCICLDSFLVQWNLNKKKKLLKERPFTTDIISLTWSIYKIVPYLYVNALKVIQIYHKSEGLKIWTFIFRHKWIKLINLHWYSSRLAILSSFWEAVKPRVVQRFTSCCKLIRVWIGYLEEGNNTNFITSMISKHTTKET